MKAVLPGHQFSTVVKWSVFKGRELGRFRFKSGQARLFSQKKNELSIATIKCENKLIKCENKIDKMRKNKMSIAAKQTVKKINKNKVCV